MGTDGGRYDGFLSVNINIPEGQTRWWQLPRQDALRFLFCFHLFLLHREWNFGVVENALTHVVFSSPMGFVAVPTNDRASGVFFAYGEKEVAKTADGFAYARRTLDGHLPSEKA